MKISARSRISGNVVSLYTKFGILGNHDEIFNGRLAPIFVALLIMAQDLPCHHDMAPILGILALLKCYAFESLVMGNLFQSRPEFNCGSMFITMAGYCQLVIEACWSVDGRQIYIYIYDVLIYNI